MKAFISGITGFAGSYLAEHLLACGDDVLGCADAPDWDKDVPAAVSTSVELITWDISQDLSADVRARVEYFAPDCIYHLAALSYPPDCGREQPTPRAWAVNVEGSRRVIDLAASLAGRPRLLLTSSAYVYAPVTRAQPYVNEQAPLGPTHPYGVTKLAAEEALLAAVADRGLAGMVARAFQHSGPRHDEHYVLPEWTRQFAASDDRPVRVRSLNTYLDLTDVRDQVRAYRALVQRGEAGAVYNVGSGVNRHAAELIQLLQSFRDRPRTVVETQPDGRPRQNPIARCEKLRRLTGWQPSIPFEQTVRDTYEYWTDRLHR